MRLQRDLYSSRFIYQNKNNFRDYQCKISDGSLFDISAKDLYQNHLSSRHYIGPMRQKLWIIFDIEK